MNETWWQTLVNFIYKTHFTFSQKMSFFIFEVLHFRGDLRQNILITFVTVILCYLSTRLVYFLRDKSWKSKVRGDKAELKKKISQYEREKIQQEQEQSGDNSNKERKQYFRTTPFGDHVWFENEFISRPTFCNVCHRTIIQGLQCEICGICSHDECMVEFADDFLSCKHPIYDENKKTFFHELVEGNLPLLSICAICDEPCGNEPTLCDFRCLWCNTFWHTHCLKKSKVREQECDFGILEGIIISPQSISLKNGSTQLQDVSKWKINIKEHIRPLLVFINPRSGGNDGIMLLRWFYSHLNPIQVADLSFESPEPLLNAFEDVPNVRVLVCGGDGTVGWVLDCVSRLNLKCKPSIAILPLGTGNDLGRALNWGPGYVDEDIHHLLRAVEQAEESILDRWRCVLVEDAQEGADKPQPEPKNFTVNNYMSIGIDAEVTLSFHTIRERFPFLFQSRTLNKIWYAIFGGKKILHAYSRELHNHLEVTLDGKTLDLPELEALVVLNINSYSAGANPWYTEERGLWRSLLQAILGRTILFDKENTQPSKIGDGVFELIGISSSFHISQLVVGAADAMQLGQGKELRIRLTSESPMQIDGEPWLQKPCSIDISHAGQAKVLIRKNEAEESR